MIKIISTIVLLSTLILQASSIELNKKQLLDLKKLNKVLNKPSISIIKGIDHGTYYLLKMIQRKKKGSKELTAFLEKSSGTLYVGSRYNVNGFKSKFPVNKELIKKGISFSYGSGKKDLYIITDPECPYCIKFEKSIHGKLDEYRVHVIFYPLPYHKNAPAMVEWIMQGKDDIQKKSRMDDLMIKKSTEYKKHLTKKGTKFIYSKKVINTMKKSKLAVKELGVRGTPSIFNANFNKIDWKTLIKKK
jgi:thiol:disulfide interchange protein DsbC